MEIYKKLQAIQHDLFVPKGNRNSFGNYNYRSCEDILKAVKPLCDANGCVLYLSNDLVNIGDRNYVKTVATLVDIESGECIKSEAHAREEEIKKGMDGSQITGAASSYARKYALAGLFSIDNEKDSDATNNGSQEAKSEAVADAEVRTKALALLNQKGKKYIENVLTHYGVDSVSKLSTEQCSDLLNQIGGKKNE